MTLPGKLSVFSSRWSLVGGAATVLVAGIGTWAVGRIGDNEAKLLLESLFPTTRFLCSAVMTGSATILALMLTLLSLSQSAERRFDGEFYERIRNIALFDTLTFVAATLLLMLHSIPVGESDKLPGWTYTALYYLLVVWSSLIAGLLVTIMLSLYNTMRKMIGAVRPGEDAGAGTATLEDAS